jgi:hypothetical protein
VATLRDINASTIEYVTAFQREYSYGRESAQADTKFGAFARALLVTTSGKYRDVWRRQSDGSWRWIADVGS